MNQWTVGVSTNVLMINSDFDFFCSKTDCGSDLCDTLRRCADVEVQTVSERDFNFVENFRSVRIEFFFSRKLNNFDCLSLWLKKSLSDT